MPGQFRKTSIRPSGTGLKASLQKAGASIKTPVQRPVASVVRRATNLNRQNQRAIRRTEARKIADAIRNQPRPGVRPVTPPRRVMPAVQAPPGLLRARAAVTRPGPGLTSARIRSGMARPGVSTIGATVAGAALAGGTLALNASAASPEISAEASALERDLGELERASALPDVLSDLSNLETALNNAFNLLESARQKEYRYQGDLEDIACQARSRFDSIRPEVEDAVRRSSMSLQNRVSMLRPQVARLNAVLSNPAVALPSIKSTHTQVNNLLGEAGGFQRDMEARYSDIETQAQQLNTRLAQIHWALDQLAEARFVLEHGEDLVMAVPARWDKEGKDDPEGVLYLTNKRLILERKEKVATKKVLFITTASELVQEVIVDQPLSAIQSFKPANRGLFGHHDYLEVAFQAPGPGVVDFHLNGQDSKDWASWVERAKSGKIEAERASGTGLNYTDFGKTLDPAELLTLQNEVNELQDEMMLKSVRDEIAQVDQDVHSLERDLTGVRAHGYALERDLEADLTILTSQWDRIKTNAESILENQTGLLSGQMTAIQEMMSRLAGMSGKLEAARPLYLQIKSTIASAEAQADAAEAVVLTQYDEYADEVESLSAHLEWIDWMLSALATASFRLLATESGVAATEAAWGAPGLEPENGVLFLTDQRLLWEDRAGAYELKLDIPLQQVAAVKTGGNTGEGEYETLDFNFGPGSSQPATSFRLALPVAESWLKMIGRARSGDYALDRAVPLDPAELERIRNAPQQCSNCGAVFNAPILRGQTEITCEYCGVVTHI